MKKRVTLVINIPDCIDAHWLPETVVLTPFDSVGKLISLRRMVLPSEPPDLDLQRIEGLETARAGACDPNLPWSPKLEAIVQRFYGPDSLLYGHLYRRANEVNLETPPQSDMPSSPFS